MTALPVIVGMGGINAAGRTSFHQGYRRIVLDALNAQDRSETFLGLATLMNLVRVVDGQLQDSVTLIETAGFDFGSERKPASQL